MRQNCRCLCLDQLWFGVKHCIQFVFKFWISSHLEHLTILASGNLYVLTRLQAHSSQTDVLWKLMLQIHKILRIYGYYFNFCSSTQAQFHVECFQD